ncbi:MAG: DoxX family protein [Acidimicrobiia bacterium]
MDWVILIGRILFAALFIGSGLAGHFAATKETAQYGEMRGLPAARALVLISGVWITAAGVMIALGIYTDLGFLMAAMYTIVAAFWVHHFWTDSDMMQTIEMTNFMKNLSLTGAGLTLFALFAIYGDEIGLQIVGPLFELSF